MNAIGKTKQIYFLYFFRMDLFTHVTTATDPENIKHVFDSVRDTITIRYIRALSNEIM